MGDDVPQGWAIGDVGSLAAQAMAAVASRNITTQLTSVELRIFLGKARWTRSQLLGEVARGSWGVAREPHQASHLRAACCHSGGLWRSLWADGRLHWAPQNPMREDYYRRSQHLTGQHQT